MKMFEQTEDAKRFHKIYLGTIFGLVIALISLLAIIFGSRAGQNQKPGPLLVPLLNNVVQNVGVDFISGEPVVIDSLTGEKINPCGELANVRIRTSNQNNQKLETTCKTELKLMPDGDYQLFDAETQKRIPSRIIKVVFALWEGSFCVTSAAGGDQYEICIDEDELCKMIKAQNGKVPAFCKK